MSNSGGRIKPSCFVENAAVFHECARLTTTRAKNENRKKKKRFEINLTIQCGCRGKERRKNYVEGSNFAAVFLPFFTFRDFSFYNSPRYDNMWLYLDCNFYNCFSLHVYLSFPFFFSPAVSFIYQDSPELCHKFMELEKARIKIFLPTMPSFSVATIFHCHDTSSQQANVKHVCVIISWGHFE